MKQLSADVVIINERAASYVQELQGSLEALVRGSQLRLSPDTSSASGKIFLLRGDLLTAAGRAQLQVIARVVLLSRRGSLAEQISRAQVRETSLLSPTRITRPSKYVDAPAPRERLQFFNGFGGFSEDGREYVTVLDSGLRDARAVDQRYCKSGVWIHRVRVRCRFYVGGEQPRKSAHSVVQRSRHRHTGRSDLHPRRKYQRGLESDGAADSRRYGHIRGAARSGLHAFPTRVAWSSA